MPKPMVMTEARVKPGEFLSALMASKMARGMSASVAGSWVRLDQAPPLAVATAQQSVSLQRSIAAGGVVREVRSRQLRPRLIDRRNNAPLGFNFIPAREQRGIAADGIQQESFICGRAIGAEHRVVG